MSPVNRLTFRHHQYHYIKNDHALAKR